MPAQITGSRPIRMVSVAVGLAALASPALAQSTAFTYQGRLTSSGQSASGNYDMRFRVYNAPSGGAQAGPTFCADNVPVSGGLFTAAVDVGQQFATGEPRYLEIEVRQDTGLTCANTTGYTVLSPRQPLTDAPRAMVANVAHALAFPNGSTLNAVSVDNSGNVGMGTAGPTAHLDIVGAQNALKIQGPQPYVTMVDSTGNNIRVLLQNENGRYFVVSESFLNGTNTGGFTMVDAQGRLGLGTFNPGATLDVAGTIKIAPAIRWKSIHGSAFQPEYFNDAAFGTIGGLHVIDSFGTGNSGTVGYQASSNTPASYFAPLELPDGATLEDLVVDGRDTSATQDLVLSIGKITLATGFVTEVAQTFTSGSSSSIQHPGHGPISEPPIDNANNVYFLRARMTSGSGGNHWLLAARVKYSITAPLP